MVDRIYEIDGADKRQSTKKKVPAFSFGTTSRFGTSASYAKNRKHHNRPLTESEVAGDALATPNKTTMGKQCNSKKPSSAAFGFGSKDRWQEPIKNGLRSRESGKWKEPKTSPAPGNYADPRIGAETLSYGKQKQSRFKSAASFSISG
jgi:hypothetical protein